MKRAVIITGNKYPCEDAGAIRQHATAKLIESLGYSVVVLGYGNPTKNKISNYDGIDYASFRPDSNNIFVRIAYRLVSPARMFNFLKRNYNDVSLLLVADASEAIFKRAINYSKGKDLILIHDSVEWFSPEQFENGEKAQSYKLRDNINRKLVGKGWRVMAISSYLEDHFEKQCDKTVRIPVIMDIDSMECNLEVDENSEKIKFAYVGAPGKKDYLKNIIEGFELLSPELLEKTDLHIVGVNNEQLISMCGVSESSIEKLKNVLFAHGRIPHDDAIRFVQSADYTVLLRDSSLRYAKAGFPTKTVESLASGTPIVCNLSSDLGLYFRDGENVYLAEDHQPASLKKALEKAITASADHRKEMRRNARKTAEKFFDYKNYISVFSELTYK